MLTWLRRLLGYSTNAGERGEQIAADWLRSRRGFSVVTCNWRNPRDRRDELDLICRDEGVLVFVEVKARSASALVPGFFAIDRRKKRVLRRSIDTYLRQLRTAPRTFRFDVVEVTFALAPGEAEVRHFENVPLFTKQYRG